MLPKDYVGIYPFMICYVDGSGKFARKSYACISDHKTHDNYAVQFFETLMNTTSVMNFYFGTKSSISVMAQQHNIRTSKS